MATISITEACTYLGCTLDELLDLVTTGKIETTGDGELLRKSVSRAIGFRI